MTTFIYSSDNHTQKSGPLSETREWAPHRPEPPEPLNTTIIGVHPKHMEQWSTTGRYFHFPLSCSHVPVTWPGITLRSLHQHHDVIPTHTDRQIYSQNCLIFEKSRQSCPCCYVQSFSVCCFVGDLETLSFSFDLWHPGLDYRTGLSTVTDSLACVCQWQWH